MRLQAEAKYGYAVISVRRNDDAQRKNVCFINAGI